MGVSIVHTLVEVGMVVCKLTLGELCFWWCTLFPPEGAVDAVNVALVSGEEGSTVHAFDLSNGDELYILLHGGVVEAVEASRVTSDGVADDLDVPGGVGNITRATGGGGAVLVGHAGDHVEAVLGPSDETGNLGLKVVPGLLVEVAPLRGNVGHGVAGLLGFLAIGHNVAGGAMTAVPALVENIRLHNRLGNTHGFEVGILVEGVASGDDVALLLRGDVIQSHSGVQHLGVVGNREVTLSTYLR